MQKKEICAEEKCTGCYACINSCPKNCIVMVKNKSGNIIPKIDVDKCADCGLCKKICPALNEIKMITPYKTYAAYAKDRNIRLKSASGGVATVISKYIILNGGVVYGSACQDDFKIECIRVDNTEKIYKLQGSKYAHSHINMQYRNVLCDLKKGKKVLFTGTPCQVSGLKQFIKGKSYNGELICIDLICHGVPSWNTFHECLKSETKEENFKNCKISFRKGNLYEITITNSEGKIKHILNLKNS